MGGRRLSTSSPPQDLIARNLCSWILPKGELSLTSVLNNLSTFLPIFHVYSNGYPQEKQDLIILSFLASNPVLPTHSLVKGSTHMQSCELTVATK